MSDHLAGWCIGFNRVSPHYVDLLLGTNDGQPLCQGCHAAWLRDDGKRPAVRP